MNSALSRLNSHALVHGYKLIIKAIDIFQYVVLKEVFGAAAGLGAAMDCKIENFPTPGKGYDNAVV